MLMFGNGECENSKAAIFARFFELTNMRLDKVRAAQVASLFEHTRAEALLEICFVAHLISGTADNFGFQRLANAAADLEQVHNQIKLRNEKSLDLNFLKIMQPMVDNLILQMKVVLALQEIVGCTPASYESLKNV